MQFGWRTFEDFFGNPEPVSLQNQFPSNHCMHNLMLYLHTLPTHSCGVHYSYLIITLDTCHPRWTFTLIWQLSQTDLANVFPKYSPLHGLTLPSRLLQTTNTCSCNNLSDIADPPGLFIEFRPNLSWLNALCYLPFRTPGLWSSRHLHRLQDWLTDCHILDGTSIPP